MDKIEKMSQATFMDKSHQKTHLSHDIFVLLLGCVANSWVHSISSLILTLIWLRIPLSCQLVPNPLCCYYLCGHTR